MYYFRIWRLSGSCSQCRHVTGESFFRAVSQTWQTEFGTTKVSFDVSMTVIATALSFIFFFTLSGVREGTIIAAILVGFISRLFGRLFNHIKNLKFA